jgi:hypothetical protein
LTLPKLKALGAPFTFTPKDNAKTKATTKDNALKYRITCFLFHFIAFNSCRSFASNCYLQVLRHVYWHYQRPRKSLNCAGRQVKEIALKALKHHKPCINYWLDHDKY